MKQNKQTRREKFKKFKKCFLGRHHVRANFYHIVSLIFVISFTMWSFEIISDRASTIIGMILFVVDYLAMMYDPHPDNPGTFFKAHFHRLLEVDMPSDLDEEKDQSAS